MNQRNRMLKERGQLTRKLLRFREMLSGSFMERMLPCGKPNCRCKKVSGKLHKGFQLTYRSEGKTKTKMIPASKAEEVRKRVALNKEFKATVTRIQAINMELLLEELKQR